MIKKVSGIAFSNILFSAFSFIFVSLIINNLSKDAFAVISVLVIYSQFITLVLNFSLDNGLLRFYNETPIKSELVSTILIFSLIGFSIVSVAFFTGLGKTLDGIFVDNYHIAFVLFLSIYTVIVNVVKAVLLAEQNVRIYGIFLCASTIIPYSIAFISILKFSNSVRSFEFGYSLGITLMIMATYVYCNQFFSFKYIVFRKKLIIEPLKFSVLILPGLLSSWIISSVDKIYLSSLKELNIVADINVVSKVSSLALLPSLALVSAFYPHFLNLKNSNVEEFKVQDRVFFLVLIITIGFIIYTFLSPNVLRYLFPNYKEANYLLHFYNVSAYINVVTGFLNFEYYFQKQTGKVSLFIALTAVLNISLIYFLIPLLGAEIVGPIALLSSMINFLLLSIYIPQNLKYMKLIKSYILFFILLIAVSNYLSYIMLFASRICLFIFVFIAFVVYFRKNLLSWRQFL